MRLKKSGRRMKTSTKIVLFLTISVGIGLIGTLVWMLFDSSSNYQASLDNITKTNQQYIHTLYVANQDIEAGDVITENMVRAEEHITSNTFNMFTADDIGKVALVDISINSLITKDVVTAIQAEPTQREVEYSCFYIGDNIKSGDYIDVRIRFTNGEDFIVLSKKRVESLSTTKKTCLMYMTELEMQKLASAIVDVAEYKCFLYSVAYSQPTVQDASSVNYPMRATSADLITMDAKEKNNELTLRKALEGRLNIETKRVGDAVNISNLSNSSYEDISNTNNDGNRLSSDYKEDENGNPIESSNKLNQ